MLCPNPFKENLVATPHLSIIIVFIYISLNDYNFPFHQIKGILTTLL